MEMLVGQSAILVQTEISQQLLDGFLETSIVSRG